MSLPNLPYTDELRREVRTEWGGLNLNESAGDGELIEAMNAGSREYPLLSTYGPRVRSSSPIITPRSSWLRWEETFISVAKLGTDSYKLVVDSDLSITDPTLNLTDATVDAVRYAEMQKTLYIFPAKQYYKIGSHALKETDAAWDSWATTPHKYTFFCDHTYAGVSAASNAIQVSGVTWPFREGDAVTIAGCTQYPENNKTAIIREIDGEYLVFYENSFVVPKTWETPSSAILGAGTYWFTADGRTLQFTLENATQYSVSVIYRERQDKAYLYWGSERAVDVTEVETPTGTELTMEYVGHRTYGETGQVTITRAVPDMDYVCVNENRLWGCKGDTIYASKLGDPLNFNVFDGLSTDSWTVETGTSGDFTGCCSYQGYPTFFKGDSVFRVLGDEPRNYYLRKTNIFGVDKGSDRSIVEIRGQLYYISPVGAVSWNGGDHPTEISHALGTDSSELTNAIGGTDGYRYYVELTKQPFDPSGSAETHLYVYDTRYGIWHETEHSAVGRTWFAWDGVTYVMLRAWMNGETAYLSSWDLAGPGRTPLPSEVRPELNWCYTFADSTRAFKTALTGSESKKGILRLLIRCRLADTMKVWIAYDGGDFEEAAEFGGEEGMAKGSRVVPLILRRCDYWQLRLTGTGNAVIYSIAVERYGGEWQQA